MQKPAMALMTVTGTDQPPSLKAAAEQLGVTVADIDESFGVILVDPSQNLYCISVRADRLPATQSTEIYRGPFADPKIAPLGPMIRRKK